jgi:hypothetical protein
LAQVYIIIGGKAPVCIRTRTVVPSRIIGGTDGIGSAGTRVEAVMRLTHRGFKSVWRSISSK